MSYLDSLAAHLAEKRRKNRASKFYIGEWLNTLDDSALTEISEVGYARDRPFVAAEIPSPYVMGLRNDLSHVCRIALAAERGRPDAALFPDHLQHLSVIAATLALQRKGLLSIKGKMFIDPKARPPEVLVKRIDQQNASD